MMLLTALIKRITVIVFLAASCNLGWQFYRLHEAAVERQRLYEETGWTVCVEAINNFAYLVDGTFLDITLAASIALLVVLNVSRAALSSFRLNIDEP